MDKPSFLNQILTLTKSTISHISAGMPKTTSEELERRLSICATCPLLDKDQFRCNSCGCFLKYKAGWADQNCPEGKW